MTIKKWLAPDIAASIVSGTPSPWLAPDIAQAIKSSTKSAWLAPDITDCLAPAAPSFSVTAAAFLARTTGLDATHQNAYAALIDGLVTDGIWAKLDMLHIYATQDSTTALLNLVSANYNGTSHGPPTFTADRGFTGTGSSYIDTNYNPTTAVSPQFGTFAAHISVWGTTDTGTSPQGAMGASNGGSSTAEISEKHSDGNCYFACNGAFFSVASPGGQGHFVATRQDNLNVQGYRNASLIASSAGNSANLPLNANMLTGGVMFNGSPVGGTYQLGAASIGNFISSADATKFYNRLRTYMTAVGAP